MQLSMTVLRCPDQVAPESRTVSGGEFHVGRGPDVDWVLPDPDRLLSKHHFAVAFRGGAWQVADTSTNGTYLNNEPDAIGRGATRTLRDGDRLRLGAYEIEIRLVDQPAQGSGYGSGVGGFGGGAGGRSGQGPFGEPFAEDLLAPPPAERRPFDEPAYPDLGMAPTSARLPHDFDALAPDRDEAAFGGFRGPVQPDHSSAMEDAMVPPPIAGYAAPRAGEIIPAEELLPDDWDKDLLEGIAPPPQTAAPGTPPLAPPPETSPFEAAPAVTAPPRTAAPELMEPLEESYRPPAAEPVAAPQVAAAPVVRQRAPRPATPPAAPLEANPFAEFEPGPARQPAPVPGQAPMAPPPEGLAPSPFDEPLDAMRAEPAPTPRPVTHGAAPPRPAEASKAPAAAPAADVGGALAAFFKGAELSGTTPADPIAMMTGLGEAFRALVSGLRAVLIARATIKGEFRIEQTMIRARGNNPLKFSANDDDALTALLGVGRHTDMAPAAAIEDSLRDLRLHELATMAAMQVAVRALLDELSPDKIRAAADHGGMAVLPAQRKARAWDAYEARHAAVVQALVDDFDSIFGKSFARAYERALDEISMKERQ
jgi:type VI secretion system FHA domain protein